MAPTCGALGLVYAVRVNKVLAIKIDNFSLSSLRGRTEKSRANVCFCSQLRMQVWSIGASRIIVGLYEGLVQGLYG